MFPSILKYIPGKKDGQFVVKVFLKHEDPKAVEYVCQTFPKNFNPAFVISDQQSKKEKELKEKQHPKNKDLQKLNTVIETVRDRIMKMYSVVTGILPDCVELEGSQTAEPCVVLLCLDKTLIPLGEQEIPKRLHEYPVVIREVDGFSWTHCSKPNNHELGSGCSIGPLSDDKRGSVGFLARDRVSKGFLTAAHVAIKELSLLSRKGTLLSQWTVDPEVYEIEHHHWGDSKCNNIIGRVEDAFIGNYGPNEIGIDAAWIKLYKQDSEGNI